jgi:hypothetical protein
LDEDYYVLISSLDFSSAFNIVNVCLLLKQLHTVGLPEDVVSLIKVWLLKERSCNVSIDGVDSVLFTFSWAQCRDHTMPSTICCIRVTSF